MIQTSCEDRYDGCRIWENMRHTQVGQGRGQGRTAAWVEFLPTGLALSCWKGEKAFPSSNRILEVNLHVGRDVMGRILW